MFMRRNSKKEEKVYELKQVDIWQCPNCIGWMQKEFSMAQDPVCPLCSGTMISDSKEISVLV